ncbi:MAG: hypothetical protein NTV63_05685 [Candidatus Woesearchaeota archaeon]|nr:hypothetical protein [Candidatus Woesearchaeota archaeon]
MRVTNDTTLAQALEIKGADEIISKFNLPCMGCPMAGFEMGMLKLGDVCRAYGIDGDSLIKELNSLSEKAGKKPKGRAKK